MGEFCELGVSLAGHFWNHLSLSGQGRPFRLLTAARTSRDATREADKAVAAAIEGGILLTSLRRSQSGQSRDAGHRHRSRGSRAFCLETSFKTNGRVDSRLDGVEGRGDVGRGDGTDDIDRRGTNCTGRAWPGDRKCLTVARASGTLISSSTTRP